MGRIAAPHGVRGSVKAKPLSGDPAALLAFQEWWLRTRTGGAWAPYRVIDSRLQSTMLVAELEGISDRDAAAALRGAEIGVPREWLPELAENEYYRADLIGLTVANRNGEVLGKVLEFVESGAHPILRVGNEEGAERLIPWVAQHVVAVDPAAGRIDVDWPAEF
jgi:16S rRNA processing protein RimM